MKKQKHTRTKKAYPDEQITETKDFAGVVHQKRDGWEFVPNSLGWYQHQLSKFKDGTKVTCYISSRKPKRTLQQNRYYWLYLTEIGKETGERNTEKLHKLFSGMFLTEEIAVVLGRQVRMIKSTTTLTKSEFSEYIDKIATETGIQSPPTESFFGEDYIRN